MNAKALDVSGLPENAMDHRSTLWWGNTLLLVIETAMFALLVATYLYLKMNFPEWPPPYVNGNVTMEHPLPTLGWPSVVLGLLIVSVIPAVIADRAALKMDRKTIIISFIILVLMGIAAGLLRMREFESLIFRWDENAYASVIWTVLALHLLHIVVATSENLAMLLWASSHPLDKKHARDVRLSAAYWYWLVGIWVFLYGMVYWGPRIL